MRDEARLSREGTALLVVDVQDRLFQVMDPERRDDVVRRIGVLATAARRLAIPVLVTEQYPKGLGATVPEVREACGAIPAIVKVEFSCCAVPGFTDRLRDLGVRTVVLAGLEAHVCILMTALDLLAHGLAVHVPGDATASRTRENWVAGLACLRQAGIVVTTTETVVFQWLGRADSADFRAVAPLLK